MPARFMDRYATYRRFTDAVAANFWQLIHSPSTWKDLLPSATHSSGDHADFT